MNQTSFYSRAASLLGALSLSACAPSAKPDPTWIDDVRPLVKANCIRCHTRPSINGAPRDFRLDRYEDTVLLDGRVIRGAGTMARFMAIRAGTQGTMPPDFARGEGLRDTFLNWFDNGAQSSTRSGNAEPGAKLLSELAPVDQDIVTLEYEITDLDDDIVTGELLVGGIVVADDLHRGRGSVEFFSGTFESGDYSIVARITDDSIVKERGLGTLTVAHPDGNTAPSLIIENDNEGESDLLYLRDALISDLQSPVALRLKTADPDATDTHTVTIVAHRGDEEIIVVEDEVIITAGEFAWDTSGVPEGPGWRLRFTLTDNSGASSSVERGPFVISHGTTAIGFAATIEPILRASCDGCHGDAETGIPGLTHNLTSHADQFDEDDPSILLRRGVDSLRGRIYRRVILEATMPPPSATSLPDDRAPFVPLSDADKATLSDYLLGGSPL